MSQKVNRSEPKWDGVGSKSTRIVSKWVKKSQLGSKQVKAIQWIKVSNIQNSSNWVKVSDCQPNRVKANRSKSKFLKVNKSLLMWVK